jgi:hypothetical protein
MICFPAAPPGGWFNGMRMSSLALFNQIVAKYTPALSSNALGKSTLLRYVRAMKSHHSK